MAKTQRVSTRHTHIHKCKHNTISGIQTYIFLIISKEKENLFFASYYKQLSAYIKYTIIRLKPFLARAKTTSFNLVYNVHFYNRRKLDTIQYYTKFFSMAENRFKSTGY